MSTTFVARTNYFPDQRELEEEWFIGTHTFSGGQFNPDPMGGPGEMQIDVFIEHIHALADWFAVPATESDYVANKARGFLHICMGAQYLGATHVSWG